MASIRRQILVQLRDRLRTITGWDVQIAGAPHDPAVSVHVDVFYDSEDKSIENSSQYESRLQAGALIVGRVEDADPEPIADGGDDRMPVLYIERLVQLAEEKIHAPDAWGVSPDFTDVVVTGHDVGEPDDSTLIGAMLNLQFHYRHSSTDLGAL